MHEHREMPEYLEISAHGLESETGIFDGAANSVDPDQLPISAELKEQLRLWVPSHQEDSAWTQEALEALSYLGHCIAAAVKAELPNYTIVYCAWEPRHPNGVGAGTNEESDPEPYTIDSRRYDAQAHPEWPHKHRLS